MSKWQELDGRLCREFNFQNYKDAWDFVNKVSEIAEAQNHHPDICFGWGYVKITTYSHDTNSITQRDRDLIKKIDSSLS